MQSQHQALAAASAATNPSIVALAASDEGAKNNADGNRDQLVYDRPRLEDELLEDLCD